MSWYVMVWPSASSHDMTSLHCFFSCSNTNTNNQEPTTQKPKNPKTKKPKTKKPKTKNQKPKNQQTKKPKKKNQKIKKSKNQKIKKSKNQKIKKSKNQKSQPKQRPTFVHACIFLFWVVAVSEDLLPRFHLCMPCSEGSPCLQTVFPDGHSLLHPCVRVNW